MSSNEPFGSFTQDQIMGHCVLIRENKIHDILILQDVSLLEATIENFEIEKNGHMLKALTGFIFCSDQ